jgi:glycosyltransferase involved in cell wall biosynthesis
VFFLGKRPFSDLPDYLRAADICLLPYVQGEATRYRSPLKLYEYLATGLPVVSTPHPEVDEFNKVVTIADPGQFVSAVDQTLQSESKAQQQQRLAVAQHHSWEARLDQMLACLQAHPKLGLCFRSDGL